jgi:hypothetical protein
MNQVGHVAVQNIKRRWLVGCLILLIGGPVMACCLVGLFTFVLPELDKFVSSDPSGNPPLLLLVLGVILIAGMIIAPSIAMGFVIQRRANMLDSIFLPLGLQGSMYMVVGHHYWGVINHRAVDVYIYRGPTMEIRVYAKSKARVQILPGKSLPVQISGVVKKQPMQGTHPQMSAYAIYADDEAWTQQLLAQPGMPEILQSLMAGHADWAVFRHVEIQPNEVLLYLHRSKQIFVKADQFIAVQAWISSLAALATLLEALPDPTIEAEPNRGLSREERQAEQVPSGGSTWDSSFNTNLLDWFGYPRLLLGQIVE